jgi:hypothetical protein
MKPTGDHQMKYQPQIVVETDGDAFANAPQLTDGVALHTLERRLHRAQEKRTCQPDAFEWLTDNALLQRTYVGNDIWQLRHSTSLHGMPSILQVGYDGERPCSALWAKGKKLEQADSLLAEQY